jgi:BASS family bile acid:Na+ symporter
VFQQLVGVLVPLCLALITFGIGVSITLAQIQEIYVRPKAFVVALASQMLALPLLAFAIASVFEMPPHVKVGLVVLAASPGGSTAGFLTFISRGNTALSITLTSVNALLTLFTIPLIVNGALWLYMEQIADPIRLPFWQTVREIVLVTLVPAGLGVLTRAKIPMLAAKIADVAKPLLLALLAGVFSLMLFGKGQPGLPSLTWAEAKDMLPWCLLLNVACMVEGFVFPGLFGLPYPVRITTAIESGVHNTTLAFLITINLLQMPDLAKPVLLYALMSFWTALLFVYALRILYRKGHVVEDLRWLLDRFSGKIPRGPKV